MRRILESVSLTAGGLLVGWLLLEIMLRLGASAFPFSITAPMRDVAVHPFTERKILPEQIWFDDDSYQLITPPGITDELHYPDPRIGLNITTKNWLDENSQVGFRVPNAAWGPRWPVDVVAVGDSFTFCYVDADDCWVSLLDTQHGFSTVNLGLVATGSISHQNVLNTFGIPHRPQVVIWQWYGNDFNDDYGFTTQYGEDAVEQKGGDTVPAGWLRQNSAVASIVFALAQARNGSSQYTQFIDPHVASIGEDTIWFGRPYINNAYDLSNPNNRAGVRLSQQAILDAKARLDSEGIQLLILLIPTKEEVYETWTADALGEGSLEKIAQGRLETVEFCQIEQIACLDVTPFLQDQARAGILVYHAQDTHLNEAGNAVLAEKVAEWLESSR